MNGLCECGCGGNAPVAKCSNAKYGYIKGIPLRFIHGHSIRTRRGTSDFPSWKGGKRKSRGYVQILHRGNHPRNSGGYVFEHILVAEKALGKHLPQGAEVHHVDCRKSNNANSNLVICESHAYHHLLHVWSRAYFASGDPNKRKCRYCKHYDSTDLMYENGNTFYHQACKKIARKTTAQKGA